MGFRARSMVTATGDAHFLGSFDSAADAVTDKGEAAVGGDWFYHNLWGGSPVRFNGETEIWNKAGTFGDLLRYDSCTEESLHPDLIMTTGGNYHPEYVTATASGYRIQIPSGSSDPIWVEWKYNKDLIPRNGVAWLHMKWITTSGRKTSLIFGFKGDDAHPTSPTLREALVRPYWSSGSSKWWNFDKDPSNIATGKAWVNSSWIAVRTHHHATDNRTYGNTHGAETVGEGNNPGPPPGGSWNYTGPSSNFGTTNEYAPNNSHTYFLFGTDNDPTQAHEIYIRDIYWAPLP